MLLKKNDSANLVSNRLPWFQRFIFPLPFAMKIIKINLWNQGTNRQNIEKIVPENERRAKCCL
jgi:hypothetical protein